MTNKQQNRLAMFLAVLGVMDKYREAWAAMIAILEMVTRLTDLTNSIQENSGVQGTPLTGISGGKRRKRVDMMEKAGAIAGDLHALAMKNNDADLQAKTAFELSDLVHLSDTVIAPRCRDIHTLATANAAALAPYGVSPEDIAALDTAISDYTQLLTAPRQAVVGRKEVTGNLAEDEDSADSLLENELDKAMRKFRTRNASFFGEYTSARMIIDLGTRHEKPEPPANGPATRPTPPTP